MAKGINVVALVKETDRYIFLYDDESPAALLQQFGKFASDPELSFSWYDAALLSQRVRHARRDEKETQTKAPHMLQAERFPESLNQNEE